MGLIKNKPVLTRILLLNVSSMSQLFSDTGQYELGKMNLESKQDKSSK